MNTSPENLIAPTAFFKFKGPECFSALRYYGASGLLLRALFILFLGLFVDVTNTFSQTDDDQDLSPPPLKTISKAERESLDNQKGVKDRTKVALALMDLRIKAAAKFNDDGDLEKAFAELGVFHAMMDDMLQYLETSNAKRGRILDNFKRFEIGLRRFTPALELIRREMPLTHEFYVRSLLRQLRDTRTKATEPLFGNTVLRDG